MSEVLTIRLPSSKSISHRVLLIQKLCTEPITVTHWSTAEDTQRMSQILATAFKELNDINVGDAGTPYRFLLAYMAMQNGKEFILSGSHRMHDRPVKDLVDALRALGAQIEYLEKEGYPPLRIVGKEIQGGEVCVKADISSQFLSALCLIAPVMPLGLTMNIQTPVVSEPYLSLTLSVMKDFGITFSRTHAQITIPHQPYQPRSYSIEADWSSACFFYAALMINPNLAINLRGLNPHSAQGDAHMILLGERFGIQTMASENGLTLSATTPENIPEVLDLTDYPDLAIPIIVAVSIKYPHISIVGIDHLAYKESDRILALQQELSKLNIFLTYEHGRLRFDHHFVHQSFLQLKSYHDHRIVMALYLFRLLDIQLQFDHPECVKKSFPNYFIEFDKLLLA